MAILRVCDFDGCTTLTLGTRCARHEVSNAEPKRRRGRPFRADRTGLASPPVLRSGPGVEPSRRGVTAPTVLEER
jgi:hypothetical protein